MTTSRMVKEHRGGQYQQFSSFHVAIARWKAGGSPTDANLFTGRPVNTVFPVVWHTHRIAPG